MELLAFSCLPFALPFCSPVHLTPSSAEPLSLLHLSLFPASPRYDNRSVLALQASSLFANPCAAHVSVNS